MYHHEILFGQEPASGSTSNGRLDVTLDNNNKVDKMATQTNPNALDKEFKIKFSDWGFKVDRLFEVAYRFYKRNENKAFHLGFDERNRMIALTMQAKFGNFDGSRVPDIGVLDLVGKRRQYEWSLLDGMSKTEAMTKFICELDEICPIFKAHAEAVKISSSIESRSFINGEFEARKNLTLNNDSGTETPNSSLQMPGMYAALCKQTHHQFKTYAQKQHPGEPDKQKHLIASLQEQYYQQYISQLKPKQIERNGNSSVQSNQVATEITSFENKISRPPNLNPEGSNPDDHDYDAVDHIKNIEELATESRDAAKKPLDSNTNSNCLEAQPNNISDINCEGDNVQADISNEELNSEVDFNSSDYSQGDCRPIGVKPQPIVESSDSMAQSPQTESNETSFMEVVKLGHNPDLHPIAMFESFPEPKLVSQSQRTGAPLDTINPNLPTKTIRPPLDNDLVEIRGASSTTTTAIQKQVDDLIPAEITLEQNQTNSRINVDLDLTQNILVDTTTCSSSNSYVQSQTTLDIKHQEMPDDFDSESRAQYGQEILFKQQPYQPELWGPISPDGGRESFDQTSSIDYSQFESASIWTKRAVAEFKDSLSGDKQGGVYEVREGSVIVIQVPTYPKGKYIYWEFATDDYDIGFGVDFVYTELLVEPLALEIYQDDEEEEDDDMDGLNEIVNWRGSSKTVDGAVSRPSEIDQGRDQTKAERRHRLANRVPILPTYRRDSHEEVHVGRHKYPGSGYYLLRFDNTYSVLRSKTLHFRICYFM